jgi:F-type H+-transporting ATPase subunit epsilon
MNDFQVEVVSAAGLLYSGRAIKLFATGELGELEILKNHAPLLTALNPGPLFIVKSDLTEESLVIFGGILEVQPKLTTVLVDAALRMDEIDENSALQAKEKAEQAIQLMQPDLDYHKAHSQLAAAVAQLRILKKLRELRK